MAEARGTKTTVHLAIEDASGDSAIIEYVNGKPLIHHGREHRVMTNDPPYDEQLALLKKMDFSKPSSEMPLPGNVNPRDRIQRASYYLPMLPEPKSEREAVAGVLAIAQNVSVPFGAPYKGFGIYNTEYRSVIDLTNKIYFFELTTTPNVIWADLSKFNLDAGSPVMLLNPDNIELSGDVRRGSSARLRRRRFRVGRRRTNVQSQKLKVKTTENFRVSAKEIDECPTCKAARGAPVA